MTEPLLEVRHLTKRFHLPIRLGRGARTIEAVDDVSFELHPGETLGLVGESGCGKSTMSRVIAGLEAPTAGTVTLAGASVHAARGPARRRLRRRMQIVFQDPYSSLNPRLSVGATIAEGIIIHRVHPRREIPGRVAALMTEVGLDPADAPRYPHEFSGGQRQRVGIARALAVEPELLICDEPVSALDVSVQAQVLNLLADLQHARGLAYLFIAHDLAVVRQLAHRIAVMYLGRLVELGAADQVIESPRHPYTRALLSAVPNPDPAGRAGRIVLAGDPPSPTTPPPGCAFAPRCFHPARDRRCLEERPVLHPVGPTLAACHHAEKV